ncbi:DUF2304 domain-containing protein [Arcanobacterium sp. S3PF19]|uniref:DUF2304 domain-containing protein n=1 Tax=Arcanobacterium sp. S3PF19 TaxID=1219585 RepID=UPI00050FB6A5|nr:DUF2304 domain-containing protein [Arcanobacterium sp. S3PF19]KGF05923.1 hypothetical protein HMPREF1631_03660 [Arcanobacterium sp. S3PF19]
MNSTYYLGIVFSLIVFVLIFRSLRTYHMKERYAHWWTVIGAAVLIISVFPNTLRRLSQMAGVIVPLNLGFFLAGIFLLLICLQFSIDLSKNKETNRRLTEEIALLKNRVEELENKTERPAEG